VYLEDNDLVLKIYGIGPELGRLKELAEQLKLENSIHFLGKTLNSNEALRQMDVFVLASLYEGFGLVLLEAMHNQVPIVSSNSEAAIEVLSPDYPLLFPIGDYKKLAAKIQQILNDGPDSYTAFGVQRLKEFKPEKMQKNIENIYSELISAKIWKNSLPNNS
jgi:glycosyltransferase involved in cell wall biosynthesis